MSEPQHNVSEVQADELAEESFDDPDKGGRLARDLTLSGEAVTEDGSRHPSTDPEDKNGNPTSPTFLIGLAKWHPFMAFFHFLADSLFPKSMRGHERIRGCRTLHPNLYMCCLVGDMLVLWGILLFLLSVAILLVCKAFG